MTKFAIALLVLFGAQLAHADAVPGQAAPPFETLDEHGKSVNLNDFKGKWVVMEWFNEDCPFVHKHYDSGNMQKLQKTYTDKGVTWLTVLSSAQGKQGYENAAGAMKVMAAKKSAATDVLLDPSGAVGKSFGAKTTPHMFVIDPTGKVVYAGGIDDNDSNDVTSVTKAKNYVAAALDAGMAGRKIETASARPYGCGVKYQ